MYLHVYIKYVKTEFSPVKLAPATLSANVFQSRSPFMSGDGSSMVSRELWKTMLMVRNTNTRRIRAPMLRRDQPTSIISRQMFTNFKVRVLLMSSVIYGDSGSRLVSLHLETFCVSFHVEHNYKHTHTCMHTHSNMRARA